MSREDRAVDGPERFPAGLLESFLPQERRAALASGVEIASVVRGAALFADIAGFTALAEALAAEHGRQRGAEEVDRNLNRVYEALIDDLIAHGGEVIYLSGDAITCWLDGDDGSRAVRCALDMQATMVEVGELATGVGQVVLSIKVAVAVGTAARFVVGDPELQRMDVLAGRLVDDLAAAEAVAAKGEVVADVSVVEALGDRLWWTEERPNAVGGRCVVVTDLLDPPRRRSSRELVELPSEIVRPWLIPEVFDRLAVGGGLFLGELRTAFPIFVRFGGFDLDDDPDAPAGMDDFVRRAQGVLHRYGGTLLGVTLGDKGAYINAVVGALHSHEDDALRSVSAALELRDLERDTNATGIQVGVSRGPIYAGTYGHTGRRTYSVLGDPTNTAARLMAAAPPGQVYVLDDVASLVEDRFVWTAIEPLRLKGKAEPVAVRAAIVANRRPVRRVTRYELPMVGRDRELAIVDAQLDEVRRGRRRIVAISADAGMGKSRFVAELLRRVDAVEVPIAYGQAESLGRTSSYVVWRDVWRRLLGLDDEWSDAVQAAHVQRLVRAVDPALEPRAPLLGTVLGIEFPDNELVAAFDAKLRKASLESLLGDLLTARLRRGPQVVVLEDLQWIDPPSTDLLVELVRRSAGLPAYFVLSFRTATGASIPDACRRLPGLREIVLGELDDHGMEAVVLSKMGQVFGTDVVVSAPVRDLILRRAQGNPFYAEEIVNYLHRLQVRPDDPRAADVELPATLNAVVLGRIDALDERPRQAVKVASVMGRSFPAQILGQVHESLGDADAVLRHLGVARAADLVVPEEEDLDDWLFRHAITREVAYESLPFSVRRTMHERVAAKLAGAGDGGHTLAGVIAHHYWHSDNVEGQRRWLRIAGDAARDRYANDAAIEQYQRLSQVVASADRPAVLLDLAGVFELVGQWQTARETLEEAKHLADGDAALAGRCDVALAEIERKNGRYEAAVGLLRDARAAFEQIDDERGLARVAHLRGTIAAQQGDLVEARRHYEVSRVARERLGDLAGLAGIWSNLGVVAEYEGSYAAARQHHERALELRREVGDRWGLGVSHTNLGMIAIHEGRYAEARDLFETSRRLCAEVGDTWMVAIADNNLGNALRGLGRHRQACDHYAAALEVARTYRDDWALAFLVEDIALLALDRDETELAIGLVAVTDRWRQRIDAPRPAATQGALDALLADVGPDERDVAAARGRAWTDEETLDLVAAWCASVE